MFLFPSVGGYMLGTPKLLRLYVKKHRSYYCKKNFFPVISMEAIIHSGPTRLVPTYILPARI